jgi:hypothetical protein
MRTFVSYYRPQANGLSSFFRTGTTVWVLFAIALFVSNPSFGQIKVGDNPHQIEDGSLIELESTNKALVVPRLTTVQRDNIPTPLKGAVIYNLDEDCLQTNIGTPTAPEWVCAGSQGAGTGSITNTILGNRIGTYLDENGIPTDFYETITRLEDNGDGSFTYINESGQEVTIPATEETITRMIENPDGSYTFINEEGVSTLINIQETVTSLVDNGDGTFTYFNENGDAISFDTNETVTTLTDNGDGTYTYRNEEGILTTIDPEETTYTLVDNGDGTYTYTDEEGNQTEISYDEVSFEILNLVVGNRIAEIIDQDGNISTLYETVTQLIDNGDGTFLYINENGIPVGFDTNETITTLRNNGDGTYTFVNEEGTTFTFGATETVTKLINNGDGTYTYTSEDDTVTTIGETLTTISINPNETSIDYIDEEGNTTNLNICNIVDNCETVTQLSFNATTGELEFIDEDGIKNTIPLFINHSLITDVNPNTNVQTIAIHTSGDGTVQNIDKSVTSLTNNGDGTFTYISEDGTTTIYDETTTSIVLNANV